MKRYFRDINGNLRESASEEYLMHSTGLWDRDKTKYVKKVTLPSGKIGYLYPDDLEPGKKYGPKSGEGKADEKEEEEEKQEITDEQRYGAGNIDLYDRPVLKNEDGSISTVESFSTNIDGEEVLLPTISRDKDGNPIRLTEDEAIEKYMKDGKHLGKFKTPEEATAYAEKLHEDQDKLYGDHEEKSEKKSGSGKYAVVSGGKHHKVDTYEEAMEFVKGNKAKGSKQESMDLRERHQNSRESSGSNEGRRDGITKEDVEAARQGIKAGKLDEKGKPKSESESSKSSKKSGSKSKSSSSSSSSKSNSKENSKGKESSSSNEKWKNREAQEAESNRFKGKSSAQISLDTDTSTSGATTRGFFGENKSNTPSVQPSNLKAKPGMTSGKDVIKAQGPSANSNRPHGHDRLVEFEKKSGAKKWHAKTATVSKGEALHTYKQMGNTQLEKFLKR